MANYSTPRTQKGGAVSEQRYLLLGDKDTIQKGDEFWSVHEEWRDANRSCLCGRKVAVPKLPPLIVRRPPAIDRDIMERVKAECAKHYNGTIHHCHHCPLQDFCETTHPNYWDIPAMKAALSDSTPTEPKE